MDLLSGLIKLSSRCPNYHNWHCLIRASGDSTLRLNWWAKLLTLSQISSYSTLITNNTSVLIEACNTGVPYLNLMWTPVLFISNNYGKDPVVLKLFAPGQGLPTHGNEASHSFLVKNHGLRRHSFSSQFTSVSAQNLHVGSLVLNLSTEPHLQITGMIPQAYVTPVRPWLSLYTLSMKTTKRNIDKTHLFHCLKPNTPEVPLMNFKAWGWIGIHSSSLTML